MSLYFFNLYNSLVGTNWHESYFATLYHDDNANQLYQQTFEERMGTNQHESYIKPIFIIIFLFSEVPVIVVRVVVSHQLQTPEVTTLVPNKRVQ